MQLSLETSRQFANLLRFAPDYREHDKRIGWANSNGIPLCFIDDGALDASTGLSDWLLTKELALRELPQEKLTWYSEYCAVAEAFDRQGILICLTKTNGPFPFWSGNIDSIVIEEDLQEACRTLESMGFVRISWLDEPHKLLYKKFCNGKLVISLHLHSRIAWDATYILGEDAIKENRLINSEMKIRIINGGPLIATLLAHAFLENRSVRLIDAFMVENVIQGNRESVDDAYRIAKKMGWGREFFLAAIAFLEADKILKGDKGSSLLEGFDRLLTPHDIDVLTKTLVRKIGYQKEFPISLPLLPTKGLLMKRIFFRSDMPGFESGFSRIGFFLKNYFIRQLGNNRVKGRIIAISGPDGSGKTTIARGIAELMGDMGVDFDTYWSRYGSVSKIFRKVKIERSNDSHKIDNADMRTVTIKSRIKLAENAVRLKVKSISTRVSGRNVIFDRYFMDTKVDFQMETGSKSNPLAKVGDFSVLKPDLHLILIANPGTLASRSEESLECSTMKAGMYSAIIQGNNDNRIMRIDASRKVGNIIDDIAPILARSFSYEMV